MFKITNSKHDNQPYNNLSQNSIHTTTEDLFPSDDTVKNSILDRVHRETLLPEGYQTFFKYIPKHKQVYQKV